MKQVATNGRLLAERALVLAALLVVGCGTGNGPTVVGGTAAAITTGAVNTPRVGRLQGLAIQPEGPLTIEAGLGAAFQIIVDGNYVERGTGEPFQRDLTRDVVFEVEDEGVARIGGDGLIQPVAPGQTRIVARHPQQRKLVAEVSVLVVPPSTTAAPTVFTALEVLPRYRNLDMVDPYGDKQQLQQLVVVATDATGRLHDLTRSVGLQPIDPTNNPSRIASISPTGLLRAFANGEALAIARLSNHGLVNGAHFVLGTGVEAQPVDPNSLYSGAPLAGSQNPIDQAVLANLFNQFIEPAPLASDGEFLRRLYADAIGRTPTEAELTAFESNGAADKRDQEIDKLLATPEFAARWAGLMGEWLEMGRGQTGADFDAWARAAIAGGQTLAEMFAAVSEGDVPAFEARHTTPAAKLDRLIQAGAGMSAKCAVCHDHPLTGPSDPIKWTQADRYPLDAFFARTPGDATPLDKTGVRVGSPYQPGFVFDPSAPVTTTLSDPMDVRRAEFARLFTGAPQFMRGLAHRVFAEVMTPLLNPNQFLQKELDEVAVPNVLDAIAEAFRAQNTSLQGFLGVVFKSAAYQLSSSADGLDPANDRLLQRRTLRRHHAEVLDAALDELTGATLQGGDLDFFHQTFGYPEERETITDRSTAVNMSQALVLQNSPVSQERLASGDMAALAQQVSGGSMTQEAAVQQIFRRALTRDAAADELAACLDTIAQAPSVQEGLEDVAAAVIGTAEFVLK